MFREPELTVLNVVGQALSLPHSACSDIEFAIYCGALIHLVQDAAMTSRKTAPQHDPTTTVLNSCNSVSLLLELNFICSAPSAHHLLHFLGYYGNIYLLSDHLLDFYRQSSAYRKQAAMVLNELVRGAAGIAVAAQAKCLGGGDFQSVSASKEDLKVAVVSIMEEYTSLNNWHLMTACEETETDRQDQQVRLHKSKVVSKFNQ